MQQLLGTRLNFNVCYGPQRPSAVLSSGTILMDQALPIKEGAARLAHMMQHAESPPVQAGPLCVEQSIQREAEAYDLELRWREQLNVTNPIWAYEFESEWRAAASPVQAIADFIVAHPEGAIGMAPLLSDYRRQCAVQHQ